MSTITGPRGTVPDLTTGPLSFSELAAWREFRTDPDAFFRRGAVLAVDLPPGFDPRACADLAAAACARHDVLRTAFDTEAGVPTRTVLPGHRPRVLDAPPDGAPSTSGRGHLLPEDLVRVWAVPGPEGGTRLSFGLHEMITDPWSCARLRTDVEAWARGDRSAPADGEPEAPAPTYAEHARRERELAVPEATAAFWRSVLGGGEQPVPACPAPDGPDAGGDRAGERILVLPDELTQALRGVCRRHRMSPFMVVTALTGLALARIGRTRDVAVTTTVSTRTPHWNDTHGNFTNVTLLRLPLPPDPTLGQALLAGRDAVLSALRHQPVPFARLAELAGEVGSGLPPTALRVHYLPARAHHYGSTLDARPSGAAWTEDVDFAGWPLDLGFAEDSHRRVAIWASYDARLFTHALVEGLVDACVTMLASMHDGGDPERLAPL